MNEQDRQLLMDIAKRLDAIERNERYIFRKPIQILDGRYVQIGNDTGTKFGLSDDAKIGFFGVTPVDRPEAPQTASGGTTVDIEARAAIESVKLRLREIGLTK